MRQFLSIVWLGWNSILFSQNFFAQFQGNQEGFQAKVEIKEDSIIWHCDRCYWDNGFPFVRYERRWIPLKDQQYRLGKPTIETEEIVLKTPLFDPVAYQHLFGNKEWYPAEPVSLSDVVYYHKKAYQFVDFYPLQIHKDGRRVRIIHEIKALPLEFNGRLTSMEKIQKKSYATTSVLASGPWFKLAINKTGIYRLDYAYLSQLGIPLNEVSASTIQCYYNGGGYVPQENNANYPDDLYEIPIKVVDGGDDRIDPGDYILFFAENAMEWKYDPVNKYLYHEQNPYERYTYVFLTYGQRQGRRIGSQNSPSGSYTTVNSVPHVVVLDEDKVNPMKSGRMWFGDVFGTVSSRSYTFSLPGVVSGSSGKIRIAGGARGPINSGWQVYVNGNLIGSVNFTAKNDNPNVGTFMDYRKVDFTTNALSPTTTIKLQYNTSLCSAWLNYIRIEYERSLTSYGEQFWIRYPHMGDVRLFQFDRNMQSYEVWDVTSELDPVIQLWDVNDSAFAFVSDQLRSFIVFQPEMGYQPVQWEAVPNQNLHGLPAAEFFIVTTKTLKAQAEALANLHRNYFGQKVTVVEADEIYNEFGGGQRDISAIRNFVRMFYDRAQSEAEMPRWLLLFGDGSYDNRGIETDPGQLPTYESRQFNIGPNTYVSDDYVTFLDPNEGFWAEGLGLVYDYYGEGTGIQVHIPDIGVGRIPVNTPEEAAEVVQKIEEYILSGHGEWLLNVVLVADYKAEDGNLHQKQTENLYYVIKGQNPILNFKKIFIENYPKVVTAQGETFPESNEAIRKAIEQGALFVNYVGHGGEFQWSNSRIFEVSTIPKLGNKGKYGFWITATCTFGKWDDPEIRSGGEQLLISPGVGAIGLYTAVRPVYANANAATNKNFFLHAFDRDSLGQYLTIGDIFMRTKIGSYAPTPPEENGGAINTRNFALLGDPGLYLNYPTYELYLTKINQIPLNGYGPDSVADTLKALQFIIIEGEVRNSQGDLATDYQGIVNVKLFDKIQKLKLKITNYPYEKQNAILFNGDFSVVNGRFRAQFYIPLDIDFSIGQGKLSLYSDTYDGKRRGWGYSQQFVICCYDSMFGNNIPPEIDLYINDKSWIDGGITSQNPLLYAEVWDDQGINVTGLGVGHELKAILNEDESNPIILNEYYKAKKDTFNEGIIEYRFQDLQDGHYTLKVKVWDITNNSAEAETDFWVTNDEKLVVDHILNYPNPFTTNTTFYFQHNKIGEEMEVTIRIFTLSGRLVKVLRGRFIAETSVIGSLTWDGLDEFGDPLGRGAYIYQIIIHLPRTGETISRFEKLVLLR